MSESPVTDVAGRPGLAGPIELFSLASQRSPEGGGQEGEPWFPLQPV
jgi:hypothetical protein